MHKNARPQQVMFTICSLFGAPSGIPWPIFLKQHRIEIVIHYPLPGHQPRFLEKRPLEGAHLPNAESHAGHSIAHVQATENSCTVAALVDEVIAKKTTEFSNGRPAGLSCRSGSPAWAFKKFAFVKCILSLK
jgi:hypothetical protein